CPGLDYCSLANARSIPVAERLALHLAPREREIGALQIKISGCINACGHHHVGHIGLLGVDKNGEEFYQITLGGSADENAALGAIIGPAVRSDDVTRAVDALIDVYLRLRNGADERFPDAYRRIGAAPFKEALYAAH
ncbi:MAG TPA: nitrite reductase, partial [Stellaceae bacterium]|nr:nitrite reductase [Stellaceae bacterium]